jgi:hypothetical protein
MSPSLRENFYCSKLVIVDPIASGLKHKTETVEAKTKIPCWNETDPFISLMFGSCSGSKQN